MIVAKATERSKMGIKSERLYIQTSSNERGTRRRWLFSYVEARRKEKGRKSDSRKAKERPKQERLVFRYGGGMALDGFVKCVECGGKKS